MIVKLKLKKVATTRVQLFLYRNYTAVFQSVVCSGRKSQQKIIEFYLVILKYLKLVLISVFQIIYY